MAKKIKVGNVGDLNASNNSKIDGSEVEGVSLESDLDLEAGDVEHLDASTNTEITNSKVKSKSVAIFSALFIALTSIAGYYFNYRLGIESEPGIEKQEILFEEDTDTADSLIIE